MAAAEIERDALKAALREFVTAAEQAKKAYIVPESVLDLLGYEKGSDTDQEQTLPDDVKVIVVTSGNLTQALAEALGESGRELIAEIEAPVIDMFCEGFEMPEHPPIDLSRPVRTHPTSYKKGMK
jgi:hypothetical protein